MLIKRIKVRMTHSHITTVHFRVLLIYWSWGTFHTTYLAWDLLWRGFGLVPSLNPLWNRLFTFFKWRIRPVPVVWRLLALTDQLNWPILADFLCWMWKFERPVRRHIVCVLLWRFPKLDVPLVILVYDVPAEIRLEKLKRAAVAGFSLTASMITQPWRHLFNFKGPTALLFFRNLRKIAFLCSNSVLD